MIVKVQSDFKFEDQVLEKALVKYKEELFESSKPNVGYIEHESVSPVFIVRDVGKTDKDVLVDIQFLDTPENRENIGSISEAIKNEKAHFKLRGLGEMEKNKFINFAITGINLVFEEEVEV